MDRKLLSALTSVPINIFQKITIKFANAKISCIFAAELKPLERSNSSVCCNGVFLSIHNKNSIGLLNLSESRCKTLLTVPKSRFNGLFLFIKTLSLRQMERSKENASSANNSNAASRVTDVNRTTIELNLTGSRNPYVFALRKAFREFLAEETKGYIFCELRLVSKIEAANLLFPEHRRLLFGKTVKI